MDSSDGAVLVSGASSGIGRACALRLARRGGVVYAGVRTEEAAQQLRDLRLPTLVPVSLDVTDPASIDRVGELIQSDGVRLGGVVNNAGTHALGPVEQLVLDDVRRVVEVNLIGQIAVVQAMLPLLRAGRGRIVCLSSIAGRVAAPMFGAYAASKFAFEAVCDALRREIRADGIHVVLVEPGAVATGMWGRAAAFEASSRYAALAAGVKRALVERSATSGVDPDVVAEVVEKALRARRPRTRYLVGTDARVRVRMAQLLPDRVVDAVMVGAFTRAGRSGQ